MVVNVKNFIARVELGNNPELEDSPMSWEKIQVRAINHEHLNGLSIKC